MTNLWMVLYFTLGISCTGLMLLVFKKIFQDKLSARWHYLIWLVLLVRALLPANVRLFSTDFALNSLWMEGVKRLRGLVELGRNSVLSSPFGMSGGDVSLLGELPFALWSVTDILFVVYLAGVVLFLLYDVLIYVKLRSDIQKGREASASLKEKISRVAERYDLPKQERVKVCGGIETPFLCGLLRPVLVIPEGMEETIDEKVLLHEMLHRKHHDVLVNFALHLLRTLNWFNPLIYVLCRIIRNDSEALCDQRALERLEGEEKREYGMLLLNMADSRHASRIGTTSMANGAKNIKTRVQRIADFGRAPKGAAFAAACITVVLSLASVSFAYAPSYFETDLHGAEVRSAADLELLLEDARYFEVTSPEMALNLFAESLSEKDLVKMALIVPQEEFDGYKEWVMTQYTDLDNGNYTMAVDTDKLHPYGFYMDIDNGSITVTAYEEDRFVEGMARFRHDDWTEEDEYWTEEFVSFRLVNENGWRMHLTDRALQEFSRGNYFWEQDILHERMRQGDYQQFGDWRFMLAEWTGSGIWVGPGFQGMNLHFFSSGAEENTFSEEMTIFANHAVVVEYVGEMWPLEVWQEEKDAEVPVFIVCPAEMEDGEFFTDPRTGNPRRYDNGGGGSSSSGDAWDVPLITEENTMTYVNGDIWCESIGEAMAELERPYEFRIYSRDGERLLTVPFEGGGLYE